MNGVWQFVTQHEALVTAGVSALFVAFVCTWPAMIPKSAQEWWTWFRDALQTAVPAARMAHNNGQNPQNPTKPADPAQPKQ